MLQTVFLKNSWLIGCIILLSCNSTAKHLPYYNTPDFTPIFIDDETKVAEKIPHIITDFSFTDQNNKTISQSGIEGKIHIANFFFTSCGSICPVLMHNMDSVSVAFKNDTNVVLLSYSVTPWIDSVQKLKKYTDLNGYTSPQWHLLTGNKAAIYDFARRSYFAEEQTGYTKDSADFLHTEHIVLVDKTRRIRGIYNGTLRLEMQQLIEDIKELEKE
ncbi:SCO family protein [Ferruginibacter albus]|uniref:SCO family protein n=1 Tax=Ferruginibacter albus TaxID=2875540 RepID=UPI001CC631C0|nr:SCO family protein [Ferruginibacter albus]UAY52899.1 SCO family protein [Ferruginibacter albus]